MAMWLAELLVALVGGIVDWVGEDVGQANDEEEKSNREREARDREER